MTNSASSVCYSFLIDTLFYICLAVISSYFQGKPMGPVSAFTTENYRRQPLLLFLFFFDFCRFVCFVGC